MSCRSFSSRGPQDIEAMLNDIEDLDYEPDGLDEDQLLQEDDQAEPPEQEFHSRKSFSCSNDSFDGNSVASSGGISKSVKSFRSNMNYKAMHIGVSKDSFRNNYVPYLESTGSRHLDSSDEESELQFSDSEPTEGFTSNDGSNLQLSNYPECQPQIDPNYVGPESPIQSLYTESYRDQNSCDSFLISPTSIGGDNTPSLDFNCSNNIQEKPRIKASNFTIQVKGNQRFCLDPFTEPKSLSVQNEKVKQNRGRWFPWKIKLCQLRKKFPYAKCLLSTDEVIQYTLQENQNSSISNVSSESNFKVPLKRPPTRQKPSSISVSVNASSGVKVVKDVENGDDDIISIIGSTSMIGLGESVDDKLIEQQDAIKMSRVAEWVDQTEELKPTITELKKFPSVYKGLCYTFFLTNQCTRKSCTNFHSITLHKQKLADLTNHELFMEAYNFAKSEPVWFSKTFHVFADIFASRGNKLALIDIIETILVTLSAESRIEGVNTVLKQLQRCNDLTVFENVIEYVRANIDKQKYPMLGEILIEIIISMDNLPSNWVVLRKMCNAGEVIPQRLAGKLLINLTRNPIDRQVCQEVWTHINEHKCLNLQLVPNRIKESFRKICSFNEIKNVQYADELEATVNQQLSRARNNFEQQTAKFLQPETSLNSAPGFSLASFDFSVPPPTFGKPSMPVRAVNNFVNKTQPPLHAFQCENMPDFASLNRQQTTFADADSNQVYLPPPQMTCGPRTRKRSTSSTGSSTGLFSDSDTPNHIQTPQSNTGSSNLMYNSQGQQYNPLDDYDYCPTTKRRHVDHTAIYDHNVRSKVSARVQTTHAQAQKVDYDVDDRALLTREQSSENVVTSSSELQSINRKAPDQPIFGRIYFDPNYEFNVSLHNSYLQRIDNVDINEDDVLTLNECVKSGNGAQFLDLLRKYMAPSTVQNFISMTLAHLKGTNQMVARIYKKLLASIETVNPYYYGDLNVRVVLEVVTMNILFELDRRAMYQDAKDVLMKFPDWDSLITSRLFITDTYTGVSIVGRYLFIARLLVSCQPELSYEILTCPNLHLLEESCKWPYHPATPIPEICESDLNNRNLVLKKFLQSGFLLNAVAVVQLYKLVLKQKGDIWRFDVRPFINPMIMYLINHKKILQLKQINVEFSMFVNHLERNVLRGFLVSMIGHLSSEDTFSILEHCMTKNVYQKLVCNRILTPVIEIKTNMCNKEIELIVLYYFHKLVELRSFPPENPSLTFEIKLPGHQSETHLKLLPHILHQSRSIRDTNQYIRLVLSDKCGISAISNVPTVVEVPAETLINYIQIC